MLNTTKAVAGAVAMVCAYLMLRIVADFGGSGTPPTTYGSYSNAPTISSPASTAVAPQPVSLTARDQHWEAMKLVVEAESDQQAAVDTVERWNAQILPLRNNASGNAIAADQDLVKKLAFVLNKDHMEERELKILGAQITRMKQWLNEAENKTKLDDLTPHQMKEVREMQAQAERASRAWARSLDQATAIVIAAQARKAEPGSNVAASSTPPVPSVAPSQSTLGPKLEAVYADSVMDGLEVEIANGPPVESVGKRVAANSHRGADPEIVKKALSPKVLIALAPFLEPRYEQPTGTHIMLRWKKDFDKKPTSLNQLRGVGALDRSEKGLIILASLGNQASQPNWSLPAEFRWWSEGQLESVKEAQQMLIDYGPTLVQEGKLSP